MAQYYVINVIDSSFREKLYKRIVVSFKSTACILNQWIKLLANLFYHLKNSALIATLRVVFLI